MSDPPYLRGALIGAAFIGFYFFPYFLSNGQTFGKRVEKIKVVDASGVDARIWRLLLRQLFMLVASIVTSVSYTHLTGFIHLIIFFIIEKTVFHIQKTVN